MSDCVSRLISHVYWQHKEQFQLASDQYEEWVMFVIESGEMKFRIAGREGTAEAGDLILCPPLTDFERETITPLTFHFLVLDCKPEEQAPIGRIRLSRQGRVADNCSMLRRNAGSRSPFAWELRSHLAHDLWLLILMEHTSLGADGAQKHAANPVMLEVRNYLNAHACEALLLKDVAGRFQLTPVQLTRQFQSAFGEKPNDYVTDLRMQQASELLRTTNWTIDAIAAECGYENGFYLSRIFTARIGMNPSSYRQKLQL
ncbi:helix-turn-helix domain-containing protein [Paenibacillus sp. HB172176]|uniref:helix-turn-helix transcriptional regulator n=1 Tax=Paenibacillus sp. HB172176 TaxID=2493690 RepID=UPI00143ACE39|nr:helix-turn-helix domain-containing protein [Paenibacillus sp. HB172176]